MTLLEQIDTKNVPEHIAIIMDGNGRWAQKHGLVRLVGHNYGVKVVRKVVKAAKMIGVKYVTFYTFSIENWNRPQDEVDGLMELITKSILEELPDLIKNGVRFTTIGDLAGMPQDCIDAVHEAIEKTKMNSDIQMTLALNYSSRWEMNKAVQEIAGKVAAGELKREEINDDTISQHLETKNMPDPELLIRTSGEQRISNYLLWQIAYSELYFTPVLWPDFVDEDLFKAVLDYQSRERRFGMVSAQINKD